MISYGKQNIDQQDVDAVIKVLRSEYLTQGPQVEKFETKLAKYCGAKYAVAVVNGTAALQLAYLAAGLKPGDEVITTPNSFVATSNMLLAVGAKPVFTDIDLATYNIDAAKIARAITKKTKAIVPVDIAGQPADLKTIRQIADQHHLSVIDDASHALGAKHDGQKLGVQADLTTFSFHAVKSITTGEGGAILTNNKKLYQKLLLLRNHGIYKNRLGRNVMTELGFNYRLTDLQATLGISQLKKIDSFVKKRRQIAAWYGQELKNLKQIILPQEKPANQSSWHLYIIRTSRPADRDQLGDYLLKRGIGVNYHYPAIYQQPYYQKIGYRKINLPNEEIYQSTCLTLPCHTLLTKQDVIFISQKIKRFFDQKNTGKTEPAEKILVTGSTGLLGSTLCGLLAKAGYQTRAFEGDITKPADLKRFRAKHGQLDWIIHTAAIANVKQCDQNKARCRAVNAEGTRNITELAKHYQAKLLYISTASIFSGQTGNYRELDLPRPANYYSQTKFAGEKIALKYPGGHVLRINLIGIHPRGSRGQNFFEWVYDSFSLSRDMKLYQNVVINPLSNWTLAGLIIKLIKNKTLADKILHLGSRDHLSKAAIGQLAAKFFPHYRGRMDLIKLNRLADRLERPNHMWLNTQLAQKKYGLTMPRLDQEISKIFTNLKSYGSRKKL